MVSITKSASLKLSDTQLVILSSAVQHEGGYAVLSDRLKNKAASKTIGALIEHGLLRDVRSKPGAPVWRKDDEGRTFCLKITRAGKEAIGVVDEAAIDRNESDSNPPSRPIVYPEGKRRHAKAAAPSASCASAVKATEADPVARTAPGAATERRDVRVEGSPSSPALPRAGSKQAQLVAMLMPEAGATLDALIAATGWLPHTVRAALTGLRKRGHAIERQRVDGGSNSIYRIVANPSAKAA